MGSDNSIIGGVLGFLVGGPLGAVAGAAIGKSIDNDQPQGFQVYCPHCNTLLIVQNSGIWTCNTCQQALFFDSDLNIVMKYEDFFTISYLYNSINVFQYLCRVDAPINNMESDFVKLRINEISYAPIDKNELFNAFMDNQATSDSVDEAIGILNDMSEGQEQFKTDLVDAAFEIALCDGQLNSKEEQFIRHVSNALGLSKSMFDQIANRYNELMQAQQKQIQAQSAGSIISSQYSELTALLPGYQVESEIGEGGMGIVYKAHHATIGEYVAIKMLHSQFCRKEDIRERFLNEAKLMSTLSHSNLVQFREIVDVSGNLGIIMEYVDGRGLDRMIGEEVGPIPHEKALPLFKQILDGVSYAHSKGIIHRDIKPSNIIITKDNTAKITDFGIAKIAGQKGMTRTGVQMGTLHYESPEQIKGARDVDHRADIYALGITLYEMLAGRLPFDSDATTSEFEIMNSIVNRDGSLDPRHYYPYIPEWLVGIVQKATELDVTARFQSCDEFLYTIKIKEHY